MRFDEMMFSAHPDTRYSFLQLPSISVYLRGTEFPIVLFSPLGFPDVGLLTPKGKRRRARGGHSCGQRFLHFVQVNVPTPKHLCP